MASVLVKLLPHFDPAFSLPFYVTKGAAGADVRASLPTRTPLEIPPFKRILIPTGLSFEIPVGFEIQVRPRSGMSLKTSLLIPNAPGTIDSDYRGELMIIMANMGEKSYFVEHGERIAQLVLAPVIQATFLQVDDLSHSERGEGGFGSTGRA